MKLPSDTLYLPIKQVYFDQIVAGTKKEEFREVKHGITANRYLLRVLDEKGNPIKDTDDIEGYVRDEEHTDPKVKKYWVDDYNNGHFPFRPFPYKKLYLAVGYEKERDTALVEVDRFRFIPERVMNNFSAFWVIAYHIGKVLEVHRKPVVEKRGKEKVVNKLKGE